LRIAAVNWELEPGDDVSFVRHLERIVEEAVRGRADVVVLPECIDLECLGQVPELPIPEVASFLSSTFDVRANAIRQLSQAHMITIIGGSMIVAEGSQYLNRCVVAENGQVSYQDKLVMTQFEQNEWGLTAGRGLTKLHDSRLGVTICYDSEFPASSRVLAEAGVLCQAVPAFTESRFGYQRVRWSCQARAIEHQIYVVHTSLVGSLRQEPVPMTYGTSAILTPSIEGFPEDSILAETDLNRPGIAIADLDFDLLLKSREIGDVRNWHDRDRGDWRLNS